VVGNQDVLTPRGDSEELAERIAHAELVVISGAAGRFQAMIIPMS
jgi:3-oxoadipate enol-lactonase